ncbi:MAG: hypothetical protein JNL97_16030 [Verrucomicrobiales bacterium]|nr:hypothetical protein [Verrucomicrobiales bacterium]
MATALRMLPILAWVLFAWNPGLVGAEPLAAASLGLGLPLGVTVAWDANPEPDVVGYRIHLGIRPGKYIRHFDVDKVTSFRIPLPLPERDYFLNITARNSAGNESELAQELPYTSPEGPLSLPAMFPTASGIEDTAVAVDFRPTLSGNPTAWIADPAPAQGRLEERGDRVFYLPNPDWFGTDTFAVIVGLETDVPLRQTWTVKVAPVEDPPSARNAWLTTETDIPLEVTLEGSDPESAPLEFEVVVPPKFGTLSQTPPNLLYTPNPGFVGVDTLVFRCSDGQLPSATAQVQIEVTPTPQNDWVQDQTHQVVEDVPYSFHLDLASVPGLRVRIVGGPDFGSMGGTATNYIYIPNPEFSGTDRIIVEAESPSGQRDTATVLFEVEPVNDPPLTLPVSVDAIPGTSIVIELSGSDPEDDDLSFEIVDRPTKGTLSGEPPRMTYVARFGQSGIDFLTYRAFDGTSSGNLERATITLGTAPVPAPRITSVSGSHGTLRLRWRAFPGLRYQVFVRDDASGSNWAPIGLPIEADDETAEWTGTVESEAVSRFFVVAVVSDP